MKLPVPESIKTERLLLRKPDMDDAEAIFASYARDPEVTRYLTWRPHRHIGETRDFLQLCLNDWADGTGFGFVIQRRSDESLLGMIGISPDVQGVSAGYVLARMHWGNGYMTEALTELRKLMLSMDGIYRFSAFCDVDNRGSARVLEKAGLKYEGRLRRYIVHPNISETPRDCYLYAATAVGHEDLGGTQ
jgi:RimJ/RimL family protein N-acetyltransferase